MSVDALSCVLTRVGTCKTKALRTCSWLCQSPLGTLLPTLTPCCCPPRELTQRALVHVLVAGWPHVPRRTRADGFAIDGVGVTVGALVAGVADAGIIQVAQQTWAPKGTSRTMGTRIIAPRSQGTFRAGDKGGQGLTCAAVGALAVEGGHAVVAGGPVEAGGHGAVVDVLAAVLARPAVDTHAVVAAVVVVAGAAVLAGVGHQLALVHVLSAVLTCQGTGHLHEAGTDHS